MYYIVENTKKSQKALLKMGYTWSTPTLDNIYNKVRERHCKYLRFSDNSYDFLEVDYFPVVPNYEILEFKNFKLKLKQLQMEYIESLIDDVEKISNKSIKKIKDLSNEILGELRKEL